MPPVEDPQRLSDTYLAEPKRRCTVTVTEAGWDGAKAAAVSVGCASLSELLERLGRGELAVVTSDAIAGADPIGAGSRGDRALAAGWARVQRLGRSLGQLPRLFLTALCALLVLLPVLYVVNLLTADPPRTVPVLVGAPETGDIVAGYEITDHFRIRPVHPVTGARNVPHNGVDVATPAGTPVYAVGAAGDVVSVRCWWDVDGGGWVANQTAASMPDHVFQSLHLMENECYGGETVAGKAIALTGNSGLGTGAHYDFRVKIDGSYVPPDKTFLEAALTGALLPSD